MNIVTCKKCRRMFNYVMGDRLCPACRQKTEEEFQEVKKFLRANPNASMKEVSEECNVSVDQIRQWLREERLILTGETPQLTCDSCGAMIVSGKLCQKCKNETLNALKSVTAENDRKKALEEEAKKKKPEKSKMRFLDN